MINRILIVLTSLCALTVSQAQILEFTDVASAYGINYSFPTGSYGVGGSLYDFNSDRLDDISFGGDGADALHFYTNTGSGFMNTNLPGAIIPESNVKCVLWVDYDNDGDLDFSCNKLNEPMSLFRNDNGYYSDVGGQSGIGSVSSYSYAGAWGDYNLDGALDHYAGNRDLNNIPNSNNRLFRSNSNGSSFTEVGATTFSQDGQGPAYAVIFTDHNKDGWPDLFIANDKFVTHNTLLENQNGSSFVDVSDSASTGMFIDGMGVAPGDFDGNGYEDIYVTNTATNGPDFGGNILVRNNGDGTFNEMGGALNLRVYEYGWGSSFADFDNDGDLDLFVANAMTWPITDSSMINNLFINQGDGTFVEDTTTAMYDSYSSSYGCAVGDINNDGYPDILVMNADGTNLNLWQNNGGINNWVKFTLEGTTSNRMAVGSWIEVYNGTSVQHRYTRCGTSYGSQDGTATMFWLRRGRPN